MKKLFNFVLLSLTLVVIAACGDENTNAKNLELSDFIGQFEAEGIEIDSNEKPMFSMISAIDGVIFYVDNQPVKIYEFENTDDIKKGEEALPQVADWERNGPFVLETSNEEAKEIFKSVK